MPISPGGFGLTAKAEVVTVSITNNTTGLTQLTGSTSFVNKYNNPPIVIFGYFTSTVSFANGISTPFEYNVSTTGFSVQYNLTGAGATFGTGTLTGLFFVYGN